MKERFPVDIDLWPAPVQGKEAPYLIIEAIKGFNNYNYYSQPDVIIIARGGGSIEDLMAFNDEKLAKAVFNSVIPIVTAIGHETDTTIIDYASDLRAPTPTAAAEKVVPVRTELFRQIKTWSDRLFNSMDARINYFTNLSINFARLLKDPKFIIHSYKEKFLINANKLSKIYIFLTKQKFFFSSKFFC